MDHTPDIRDEIGKYQLSDYTLKCGIIYMLVSNILQNKYQDPTTR